MSPKMTWPTVLYESPDCTLFAPSVTPRRMLQPDEISAAQGFPVETRRRLRKIAADAFANHDPAALALHAKSKDGEP